jgi:hypothetical protein
MELNQALDRVRKLIQKAEAPNHAPKGTPEWEATERERESAQEMADAIMLKFQIDEIILEQDRPVSERQRPGTIEIELSSTEGLSGVMADLARMIADHCRCRIRTHSRYNYDRNCYMTKVYGFESDLRYFEFLYTTVRLHMIGVLRPKVDATLSLEENCYNFHEAGYNWLEIAGFYGWEKLGKYDALDYDIQIPYRNKDNHGEILSSSRVGSYYKRAYYRACARRHEEPQKITAGGAKTYRKSAADGYGDMLGQRLRRARNNQDPGAEVMLASRLDILEELFRQDNPTMYTKCPECKKMGDNPYDCEFCGHHIADRPVLKECERCKAAKSGTCRAHSYTNYKPDPVSAAGYAAGVRHANTVDLSPSAGSAEKRAIS